MRMLPNAYVKVQMFYIPLSIHLIIAWKIWSHILLVATYKEAKSSVSPLESVCSWELDNKPVSK